MVKKYAKLAGKPRIKPHELSRELVKFSCTCSKIILTREYGKVNVLMPTTRCPIKLSGNSEV